jgi:hypothetical protein
MSRNSRSILSHAKSSAGMSSCNYLRSLHCKIVPFMHLRLIQLVISTRRSRCVRRLISNSGVALRREEPHERAAARTCRSARRARAPGDMQHFAAGRSRGGSHARQLHVYATGLRYSATDALHVRVRTAQQVGAGREGRKGLPAPPSEQRCGGYSRS